MLEAVSDTLLGFFMGVVLQRLVYGDAATWLRAGSLTMALYGLTMLRRFFVWLGTRADAPAPA